MEYIKKTRTTQVVRVKHLGRWISSDFVKPILDHIKLPFAVDKEDHRRIMPSNLTKDLLENVPKASRV